MYNILCNFFYITEKKEIQLFLWLFQDFIDIGLQCLSMRVENQHSLELDYRGLPDLTWLAVPAVLKQVKSTEHAYL